jgi:hypothetical protein
MFTLNCVTQSIIRVQTYRHISQLRCHSEGLSFEKRVCKYVQVYLRKLLVKFKSVL